MKTPKNGQHIILIPQLILWPFDPGGPTIYSIKREGTGTLLNMIPADLLEILACPACREALTAKDDVLRCTACGRNYPIRDGIPILLVDQARMDSAEIVAPITPPPSTKQ